MSVFSKKKVRSSASLNPAIRDGAPLGIPIDDEALIHELIKDRQSKVEFAAVVEFHHKKMKDITGITLMIDTFLLTFIRAKKILNQSHIFHIEKVEHVSPREIILFLKDDPHGYTLKTHWSHSEDNMETIISSLLKSFRYSFPFASKEIKPFLIYPPTIWDAIEEIRFEDPEEVGPCLGYDRSYKSICYFRDIVPKKETITQIQVLENHKHKSLNLFEFSHASIGELVVLIQALQYNTYFTSFVASGYQLQQELVSVLIQVLLANSTITELVISGTGLTPNHMKELSLKISEGCNSISIRSFDLSRNPIEDKGLEYFSEIVGNLGYGLIHLHLSELSFSKKGALGPLITNLRENSFSFETLTSLDLSSNKLDSESSVALSSWLSHPNCLSTLNLSSTRVMIDKLADGLSQGCCEHLTELDLSENKFKNIDQLTLFVKGSQKLQNLNLSSNPLEAETLLNLIKTISINYSLRDFELHIRDIGLGADNCQKFLELLSHNIKFLDMSQNFLGPTGLEIVGNGLAQNNCLETLIVNYCFQYSKSNSPNSLKFAQFLQNSKSLKVLSMKADEPTALKSEILPIVESLTLNTCLTSLNISGNQGEDILAVALGRLLQVNGTLRTLEIDDNSFSIVGFQRIRDGLMRNSTLTQMPTPVMDAMSVKKKRVSVASGTISGAMTTKKIAQLSNVANLPDIIKDIESKVAQNYSKKKTLHLQIDIDKRLSSSSEDLRPRSPNVNRQKDLDSLVQKIGSNRIVAQDKKNVFVDVNNHVNVLSQFQSKQEELLSKFQAELNKRTEEFSLSLYTLVSETNRKFTDESLKHLNENYIGLSTESREKLTKFWRDEFEELQLTDIQDSLEPVITELYTKEDELTVEMMNKTSHFLYETISGNLQSIMTSLAIKDSDSDSLRSLDSPK